MSMIRVKSIGPMGPSLAGLGAVSTPSKDAIQAAIVEAAPAYGVPANIALAVAKQESGFSMAARGAAGEVGVYQLMPGTAAGLGVDPYNSAQNIQGGLTYLSQMYAKYGDWDKALAAYNAGPGNVDRGIIPTSTRAYIQSINAIAQTYLDFVPDPGAGTLPAGDVGDATAPSSTDTAGDTGTQDNTTQPTEAGFIPGMDTTTIAIAAGIGIAVLLLLRR